jgi:hypothetical protein
MSICTFSWEIIEFTATKFAVSRFAIHYCSREDSIWDRIEYNSCLWQLNDYIFEGWYLSKLCGNQTFISRVNKCRGIRYAAKSFSDFVVHSSVHLNSSPPNDIYTHICICRTAPLTSRRCILCIYLINIRTEYFKHAASSPCFFFKMPFISCYLVWFLYYSHFKYRVC